MKSLSDFFVQLALVASRSLVKAVRFFLPEIVAFGARGEGRTSKARLTYTTRPGRQHSSTRTRWDSPAAFLGWCRSWLTKSPPSISLNRRHPRRGPPPSETELHSSAAWQSTRKNYRQAYTSSVHTYTCTPRIMTCTSATTQALAHI